MDRQNIVSEVKRTIVMEANAIESLTASLNYDAVADAVRMIGGCKGRILIAGCGTSAMACKKICHSLCCIERPAMFLTPSDAVHGGLGLLQPSDILILISKGGNTLELLPLIAACKSKKVPMIAVTENPESRIAAEADLCLEIKVAREPCRFNMLATSSTLAVISVFDAICIALMQYTGYTREQFAVIHPGGAVGDRLLGKEAHV